jgi:hypothetical protein
MLKRLQYLFLAFFLSLSSLFAAENFLVKSFNNILGNDGLGALLKSESFLYGFYFLLILFSMQSIFKSIFLSIKLGEKPSNIVSFMFSAIGTSGIFFMFKDNQAGIVSLFGGFFGFIIILILGFIIAKTIIGFNKGEKVFTAKWFAVVFGAAFVYNILLFTMANQFLKSADVSWINWISTTTGGFIGFLAVGFIISLTLLFLRKFKGSGSSKKKQKTMQDMIDEDPHNKVVAGHISEISKSLDELQTAVNQIDSRRLE